MNTVNHLLQLAGNGLYVVLIAVFVLIALTVLFRILRSFSKGGRAASSLGFFRMHDTTIFERQPSVQSRRQSGTVDAGGDQVQGQPDRRPVAVLEFTGDIQATGRKAFARQVDEVIINKDKFSMVVVVLDSPGGSVAEYGHMFALMKRLRDAGLTLIVCVDTYAASGGYLASTPANRIIAAPFAMVGSIGVVMQLINYHDLLREFGIVPLTLTAGKWKRPFTPTSPVTDEGIDKLREQLETIHKQFKTAVKCYRPQIDIEAVCTGEHWTALESVDKNLGLVDEIETSQGYLFKVNQENDLVFITHRTGPFESNLFRLLSRFIDLVTDRFKVKFIG